jgi:dihydroorotate dehydrogenase (fumarate)
MSVDLATRYLGLSLDGPLVPSASPLGRDVDVLRALQDAGASAVVLPSLFEEQLEREARDVLAVLQTGTESFAESLTYFPPLDEYDTGPAPYLRHVEAAKAALHVPVIASLNGASPGGWTRYARQLQEAGADAIELNVYAVEADPSTSGAQVEARTIDVIRAVRAVVTVPLAVKIGPFTSALAHFAVTLEREGVDGLVLFNRFVQPDIDLDALAVVPGVRLSDSGELLLPLRWTALLRAHVHGSIAVSSGVHEPADAVKAVLAGADVVMCASALLRHGPQHLARLRAGVESWLSEHGYESVVQARGSLSAANVRDPGAYERSQYVQALVHYSAGSDGGGAPRP